MRERERVFKRWREKERTNERDNECGNERLKTIIIMTIMTIRRQRVDIDNKTALTYKPSH